MNNYDETTAEEQKDAEEYFFDMTGEYPCRIPIRAKLGKVGGKDERICKNNQ